MTTERRDSRGQTEDDPGRGDTPPSPCDSRAVAEPPNAGASRRGEASPVGDTPATPATVTTATSPNAAPSGTAARPAHVTASTATDASRDARLSAAPAAPPAPHPTPLARPRRGRGDGVPSSRTRPLAGDVVRLLRDRELPGDLASRMHTLLELLADPTAPTSVHDPRVAIDVHLADSLIGLDVPEIRRARRLADVGTGAGLPGLPLALALPDTHVALVESQGRKCTFLEATLRALALGNAEVVCARVEELGAVTAFDAVTARALAPLPVLCEYAAPLLAEGGALVAWKGAVSPAEEADSLAAAAALGLARTSVRQVEPYPGSERRTLHIFSKMAPTPAGYPRRPGRAVKRPLRAPVTS